MARRAAIRTDHGLLVAGRMNLAVHGQHRDRHFQHDGVNVVAADRVRSVVAIVVGIDCRGKDRTHSVAKVDRVEECAQINEERIVCGSCPYADSIAEGIDALVEERLVVRHGQRTHIGRHRIKEVSVRR